ncbi:MAG TPA: F420-nonreducing hydrogenase [Methanothermococcus okinawensis]|uniref:F420-nonreducing hydrogenase n=1 Tax=Methanothermococcus okinawensis TaxID=155863 RepID=A0A833A7Q6_9EURY|nr:F420-nonreducing hydrogenase [Methanothermococcus okinawensis]
MGGKAKLGMIQLCGCSGCHISLLDLHDQLHQLLPQVEILFAPIVADMKEIPEGIDVFLVEGGIRNEHEKHLLEEIREKSKVVVAWGTCAAYGGIPGLGNLYPTEELLKEAFSTGTVDNPGEMPEEDIPKLLDRVYPISHFIDVDFVLPGCPPKPEHNLELIGALLEGREPKISKKIVCDQCPRKREGTYPKEFKRTFEGTPDRERCLFEQGYTCVGMATRAGCGAVCPSANVPCRGCYGKTDAVLDQGAAVANAYALTGDAALKLPDKLGLFYRFSMAAGLIPKKIHK